MVAKVAPKTRQQLLEQRRAELDAIGQMQQADAQERAARQAEHQAFLARVQQRREQESRAVERGEELPPVTVPTLNQVYEAKAAEEKAEAERAEAERIAALTPREIWLSTLAWADRQHVYSWERVNPGMTYPVPGLK